MCNWGHDNHKGGGAGRFFVSDSPLQDLCNSYKPLGTYRLVASSLFSQNKCTIGVDFFVMLKIYAKNYPE